MTPGQRLKKRLEERRAKKRKDTWTYRRPPDLPKEPQPYTGEFVAPDALLG